MVPGRPGLIPEQRPEPCPTAPAPPAVALGTEGWQCRVTSSLVPQLRLPLCAEPGLRKAPFYSGVSRRKRFRGLIPYRFCLI